MSLQLNTDQQRAVHHNEGPCMVIAGPGAGKTRVITQRIIRLIQEGVASPYQILALTFTKKAAQEMQRRIAQSIPAEKSSSIWIGTFHSIFSRILRIESKTIGLSAQFTIYDQEESKSLLKTIIKELNLDPKAYPPEKVLWRICQAKKKGIDAEAYAQNEQWKEEDRYYKKPHIHTLFGRYQVRCQNAQALDFDDILLHTHQLFKKYPEIIHKYQERFRYVLVDEFQDTNDIQYAIVRQLAGGHKNLFVVGDDAQSIYAFQGAEIEHMLHFKKKFPTATIIKLQENYRSTKRIVQLANQVIKQNAQHPKELFTQNEEGELVQLIGCPNELEEACYVAQDIFMQRQQNQVPFNHFAVIYRTNRQSRPIEEALRKVGIPYQVVGGLSFYQRKEVKDLIAYLRLLINPNDEQAIQRAINLPKRGIGPKTLEKMRAYAEKESISFWESLEKVEQWSKGETAQNITQFVQLIERHQASLLTERPHEVAQSLAKASGLLKLMAEEDATNAQQGIISTSRQENVAELIQSIRDSTQGDKEDGSLASFLQEVALFLTEEEKKDDQPKVILITAHKAKGLEWEQVYVTGMMEEVFPSWHMIHNRKDIEEERRLFFVVVSRAQKRLTITYPKNRFVNGSIMAARPSRFLKELDPSCLKVDRAMPSGENRNKSKKMDQSLPQKWQSIKSVPLRTLPKKPIQKGAPKLSVGTEVKHPKFGEGRVVHLHDQGSYPKVEINFHVYGRKVLLLHYADLIIVSEKGAITN